MSEIAKRYATDEAFREVANLLYGEGVEIYKANPDQSDLSARRKREQTQARVGLATNIVGIAAGTAGTVAASRNPALRRKKATHKNAGPVSARLTRYVKSPKGKMRLIQVGAASAAGLQAANLAGDAIANRVLSRAAKSNPDVKGGPQTTVRQARKKVDMIHKNLRPLGEYDVKWEGEISKLNVDKQQVFGWASIVEMNGEPVVDLQGDYIAIDEVEKSAYEYVHKSRKGGDMHLRDGDEPVVKSHMIESFVVTPEKKKALGLPEDTPTGWWVGYQINDPELWGAVKDGKRTGFSIHGRGVRTPAS
jgi:hypothetical protein